MIGIVGSPRKNGRTNSLVDAALEGARSKGVKTRKIYLIDYDIKSFTGLEESWRPYHFCPEELSRICDEAKAIVLGAPVYWGDINGLTKDFMETVRIPTSNGKPALGIAIAGGSGKGLLSGVQSLYHFFFHKQMKGIDPTPVSRFNMQEALERLNKSGVRLAKLSEETTAFEGKTIDERWPEVLAHYATVEYMKADPLDEFVMLTRQLITISDGRNVEKARNLLDTALSLIQDGEREEASRYTVKAYQTLYFT